MLAFQFFNNLLIKINIQYLSYHKYAKISINYLVKGKENNENKIILLFYLYGKIYSLN